MTRIWCARLALLGSATLAVTETYRRGYVAPLLFGARLWISARPDRYFEPDYMA